MRASLARALFSPLPRDSAAPLRVLRTLVLTAHLPFGTFRCSARAADMAMFHEKGNYDSLMGEIEHPAVKKKVAINVLHYLDNDDLYNQSLVSKLKYQKMQNIKTINIYF